MTRSYRLGILTGLLIVVPGCGDSWGSLQQMKMNIENEVVDLMSKVRDEESAKWVVENNLDRVKAKWEAWKARRDKYLKSQFLGQILSEIDKVREAEPKLPMAQVIDRLTKRENNPIKKDQEAEIKKYLSVPAEKEQFEESDRISDRRTREGDRIRKLRLELQKQNPGKDYQFLDKAYNFKLAKE